MSLGGHVANIVYPTFVLKILPISSYYGLQSGYLISKDIVHDASLLSTFAYKIHGYIFPYGIT